MLHEDSGPAILKDDVIAWIAATKLGGNFLIEIVLLVLGFPIAKGYAKLIDQRAIDDAPVAVLLGQFVLRNKD